MLNPTSWQIGNGLYLVHQVISAAAAVPPKPEPVDHVTIVDASGSMWDDLPRVRAHLKAKWATLTNAGDTMTLLWFSGPGQCGILFEAIEPSLTTQAGIDRAIDKLQPVGLTSFKDPLVLVTAVLGRLTKLRGKKPTTNLFFMSDGCDKCSRRADILALMKGLSADVSSATMVSYGYYADLPLLTGMAEAVGGTVISSTNFRDYEPTFEKSMRKTGKGGPSKVQLVLDAPPVGGFVYAFDNGDIITPGVDALAGGRAGTSLPSYVTDVFYLSEVAVGKSAKLSSIAKEAGEGHALTSPQSTALSGAYALLSLFAQRIQPKIVWEVLRTLGDVRMIDDFFICFGKQRYVAFTQDAKAATFGEARYVRGYDPARAPREDAFTLLDLLDQMEADPRIRILSESDAFVYSRIGRKAVSKHEMLTVKESKEVDRVLDEMKAKTADRRVSPLLSGLDELDKILRNRTKPLKFHLDKEQAERGYSTDDLVRNASLANLSTRIKQTGYVDLSEEPDVPEHLRKLLPGRIQTYRYKTYTWMKDGLVHIDAVPLSVPKDVLDKFIAEGIFDPSTEPVLTVGDEHRIVLNVKKIPIITQRMVKAVSAASMAEKEWELLNLQAAFKVYNFYTPPRESKGFVQVFGAEAAKWLQDRGLTDFNGYRADTADAPATDKYVVRELNIKIPGFSSLPEVEDTRERMANEQKIAKDPSLGKGKGKLKGLTTSGKLLVPFIKEVDDFLDSDIYKKAADQTALFNRWVEDKKRDAREKTRKLNAELSKERLTVLVGQTWFFPTFDENTIKITLGGELREVTFALREDKEIDA